MAYQSIRADEQEHHSRSFLRQHIKLKVDEGYVWIRIPKEGKMRMAYFTQDQDKFINCARNAILHARQVCRREKHLDCRSERIGAFVVSLRRELRQAGFSTEINDCCDTRSWLDAGVLNSERTWTNVAKYKTSFEVAMSLAGKQGDVNYDMNELAAITAIEQGLAEQAKNINSEADKVLEGFRQLVVNM